MSEPNQIHSSMPSVASCPLCAVWCASPGERAFSRGELLEAQEAHKMFVMGYWLARNEKLVRPVCNLHREYLGRLDRAQSALERNESLAFRNGVPR